MGRDQLTQLARRAGDDDPVAALAAVAEMRRELERQEAVLVRRARTQGASWAQIAESLGVSRQAVHKKHGGRRLFGSEG
ncbi:helix-turn-helix domain-containing protein [Streptomyces sp. NPDC017979]|uniref:helix-turn-helix domain-containing protein n=1 Tax=Streptomyces sp. NPDC017979 TaxID=3365024 RepID=UPI0037BB4459